MQPEARADACADIVVFSRGKPVWNLIKVPTRLQASIILLIHSNAAEDGWRFRLKQHILSICLLALHFIEPQDHRILRGVTEPVLPGIATLLPAFVPFIRTLIIVDDHRHERPAHHRSPLLANSSSLLLNPPLGSWNQLWQKVLPATWSVDP
ncbi:hypothetical protein G7046_g8053 [Stylonectria norvegica]|nr:hypothetical protein G7046_g8053 [Stylonectria norvegica]